MKITRNAGNDNLSRRIVWLEISLEISVLKIFSRAFTIQTAKKIVKYVLIVLFFVYFFC